MVEYVEKVFWDTGTWICINSLYFFLYTFSTVLGEHEG